MRRNLRNRALIRPPSRLIDSSSEDEESNQVDELVEEALFLDLESRSDGTDESENLSTLQQELDRAMPDKLSLSSFKDVNPTILPESTTQAPTMATLFELDPYAGNINPADSDGRKLFLAATKERDDDKKFTVKQENAKVFLDAILHDSSKFGLESLVHSVPVCGNGETLSIFTLMAKKHLFRWQKPSGDYEYDGPTALFLVLESVNPSTRVGVARLKKKLRETRLGGYNHNVRDMLTAIQSTYTTIEELGFKHDNIVMETFEALLSTKNQVFKDFIQRKKDGWETGDDLTLGDLSEYALNKYNNMVE